MNNIERQLRLEECYQERSFEKLVGTDATFNPVHMKLQELISAPMQEHLNNKIFKMKGSRIEYVDMLKKFLEYTNLNELIVVASDVLIKIKEPTSLTKISHSIGAALHAQYMYKQLVKDNNSSEYYSSD